MGFRAFAQFKGFVMAKAANIKIKLLSTADTGFFFVAKIQVNAGQ